MFISSKSVESFLLMNLVYNQSFSLKKYLVVCVNCLNVFVYFSCCLFTHLFLHNQLIVSYTNCLFTISTLCLLYQLFVYEISCLFAQLTFCLHYQLHTLNSNTKYISYSFYGNFGRTLS